MWDNSTLFDLNLRTKTHPWCSWPQPFSALPLQRPKLLNCVLSDLADRSASSPGHSIHFLCWERIQTRCSETRIQSSACEMSSSTVIPYTSSAYSHIQRSALGFPVCARWRDKRTQSECVFNKVQRLSVLVGVSNWAARQQTLVAVDTLNHWSRPPFANWDVMTTKASACGLVWTNRQHRPKAFNPGVGDMTWRAVWLLLLYYCILLSSQLHGGMW